MRGRPNKEKECADCGACYMPVSNRQKLCPDCGRLTHRVEASNEPSLVDHLLAVLRYGPLTSEQIRIRLRNHSMAKKAASAIHEAHTRGLIERRPYEGWALVEQRHAEQRAS